MDRLVTALLEPGRIAFHMDADAWPGGAEGWLTLLMSGLVEAGWSVSLFLTDKRVTDPWVSLLAQRGVAVERVRATREVDPGGVREAERFLRGFPLVHVNKPHPRASLPTIQGARRAGARAVVASEHVVSPPASRYPFGASLVRRLVSRTSALCDVITVPSEASRGEYVGSYDVDPDSVVTVRGAVDLSRFDGPVDRGEVCRSIGVSPDDRVVAVVGRLCEGKGLETALRAATILAERVPAFRLALVGDGDLASRLRALASELGVAERVVMVGARSDVPDILRAVDLLAIASVSETSGLVAMEAAAAGLPVVATRVGGLSETIEDGVTGLLVAPRDERELARGVEAVLGDGDLASRMGRAGRERAEREYGADRLVETMTGIYWRLLAGGGQGG